MSDCPVANSTRLLSLAALMTLATTANGETFRIYVDKSAPAGGNGASWQTAFRDLQDAIKVQTSKDAVVEIRMAQGIYTPDSGTGDRTKFFGFHYALGSAMSLSLHGSFAGLQGVDPDARDYISTPTVLSGDLNGDDGPAFTNRSDNSYLIAIIGAQRTLSIDGMTVRGASADQKSEPFSGGGMLAYVQSSGSVSGPTNLRVTNCNFEDNDPTIAPAGALSAYADQIEVWDSRFVGNRLRDRGGGALTLDGAGSLYRCTFDSNSARYGGAIYSKDDAFLSACVLTRNEAEYQGGAVFGSFSANISLFAGNRAGSSGGAAASYASLSLVSCTIADNTAPSGAAISVVYGVARMTNVVAWGNTGSPFPIRLIDNIDAGSIEHSVLQGGVESIEMSGMPVDFSSIRSNDPSFIRPQSAAPAFENWNYRLASGSAAKGIGGDDWISLSTDLDGAYYQRKFGAADAGCYFDTRYLCEGSSQPLDSVVNDEDFVEFSAAYNLTMSPPAKPNADFNRDGLVNDADFEIFVVGYDRLLCPPPW